MRDVDARKKLVFEIQRYDYGSRVAALSLEP